MTKLTSLGDVPAKQQDQPLSGAGESFIGKISGPIEKPVRRQKTRRTENAQVKEEAAQQTVSETKETKPKRTRTAQNTDAHKKTTKTVKSAPNGEKAPAKTTKSTQTKNNKGRGRRTKQKPSVRGYCLGGLNEIGKNFTLFECEKLKEHNLGYVKLNVTTAGSHIQLGCFDVELIHVNHSISDAVGLALHTPAGVIVHTGDFKIDFTPTQGGMIDLARFAQLGQEGVLLLMADSTNAERPGYTQTEQKVNATFDALFARAEANKKRLIIATFASNISRVQQIINCAEKYGRKVALSGRSMVNVMSIASELGYLKVPDGLLIDLNMISRYTKEQIVLITTGSQGEPMSALTRMAFADHRQVAVGEDDMIIISARPIPGNEKMVGTVVDELLNRGCDVVYESMYEVHVSGHACQEELKLIQALTKPKYFIPVHGEQKHLRKHAGVAVSMGMPPENIFIGDVGSVVEIHEDYMKQLPDVQAGAVMVDGLGVGDVGSIVLRDRKHLAEDGLIIAVCTIEAGSGRVVSGPDIVSRGFVYVRESEALMDEARRLVNSTIEQCADENVREWSAIKLRVRDNLSRLLYNRTKRSPMILPIIMEV